jgi:hypothetical protein
MVMQTVAKLHERTDFVTCGNSRADHNRGQNSYNNLHRHDCDIGYVEFPPPKSNVVNRRISQNERPTGEREH